MYQELRGGVRSSHAIKSRTIKSAALKTVKAGFSHPLDALAVEPGIGAPPCIGSVFESQNVSAPRTECTWIGHSYVGPPNPRATPSSRRRAQLPGHFVTPYGPGPVGLMFTLFGHEK